MTYLSLCICEHSPSLKTPRSDISEKYIEVLIGYYISSLRAMKILIIVFFFERDLKKPLDLFQKLFHCS